MTSKAAFVRTRPLDEPVESLIAAAKQAGIRNMARGDIYEARKQLRNVAALEKASEAMGGKLTPEEPASEEERATSPARRKRIRLVPKPGTDAHRVHEWLANYVREHKQGPPNIAAVAGGTGLRIDLVGALLQMLRTKGVISNEYRDLRTMQILRAPAILHVPHANGKDTTAEELRPGRTFFLSDGTPTAIPPTPEPPPSPPYLAALAADLGRLLSQQLIKQLFDRGAVQDLDVRIRAVRLVLEMLTGEAEP